MRSVTLGIPLWEQSVGALGTDLVDFMAEVRAELARRQWTARSTRLTLPPIPAEIAEHPGAIRSALAGVQALAEQVGARWYCLPVDLIDELDHTPLLGELLECVVRDQRLFLNLMVANETAISIRGARAAAEFVLSLARRSHSGVDAFRVGISTACRKNTPFFPFSRHEGDGLVATFALETTKPTIAAVRALPPTASIADKRAALLQRLTPLVADADALGRAVESSRVAYGGLDASFAPFPDPDSSVGTLIESFGVSPVGASGTLFVTSMLTDVLRDVFDKTGARAAGFNGVMYSVLEDPRLASANDLAALSLEKLMLFSSLCGCGLDMVPITVTTYLEDVIATVLDVAALSLRLEKPLGVRLVPIPGRQVNQFTTFNLDFLCDSRVMTLVPSESRLGRDEAALFRYMTRRTIGGGED